MNYEYVLFDYLRNLRNELRSQPLVLGSNPVTSGTGGGPPGGFVGYLRQDRVSFDIVESEDNTIPASGMSLTTNLNRIRYRIAQLEDNPAITGITLAQDGVTIASGVTTVNFVNASVVETTPGYITVTCSGTGGGGETTTISGISYIFNEEPTIDGYTYTTTQPFASGTISVYYNGLKQSSDSYTLIDDQSFYLEIPAEVGDTVTVDYGVHNILFSGTINSGSGTSVHNDLTGLQGGTTDEYYHLTQAQYNTIASGIGCRLYRATDQTIGNASLEYVNYSTERWNNGLTWSASEPSVISIVTPGTYIIVVQNQWSSSSTTGIRVTAILLNGEIYLTYQSNAGSFLYQNVSTIYKFEADDYIQIMVYQTSGGNLNLQKDASGDLFQYSQELSIQKIG